MKALIYTAILIGLAQCANAQSSKIDLSKAPGAPSAPLQKKSNATLLQETTNTNTNTNTNTETTSETDLAEQYSSDGTINNGTYRKAAPAGNSMNAQPEMMNATQHKGNIGNLQTTSETYYDNSGKIRSTGTTIKLGK